MVKSNTSNRDYKNKKGRNFSKRSGKFIQTPMPPPPTSLAEVIDRRIIQVIWYYVYFTISYDQVSI